MTQTTWDDFTKPEEPATTTADADPQQTDAAITVNTDEECCPWCYAPEELYRHDVGFASGTACTICETMIPVNADWYKRGEKVVNPSDVPDSRLEQIRAARALPVE